MRKIFYGWVIVGAGLLVIAVASGMVSNCFSLMIVPICDELGFSRAQIGVCQTILSLGCVLAALFAGALYRRFRLIRLMQAGAVACVAAYYLLSRAQALWAFYACACVCAAGVGLLTWMPFSVIINNWFHARRAFAVGLTYMGSGLGGMAASAAGAYLIGAWGWRATVVCFSGVLACVLLPIVFLVIRVHPSEMNLKPYGETDAPEGAQAAPAQGARFAGAARTGKFALLIACLVCAGMACNGLNATLAAHLEDSGYSQPFAAGVFSAYMLLLAGGKTLLGYLFDKIGVRRATYCALASISVSMLGLAYCRYPAALIAMLAFCGVGIAVGSVGVPVMARAVYGQRDFASFAGMFSAAANTGSAIAPTLLGAVCDLSGAYTLGYILFAVLMLGCIAIARAYLPARG